MSGRCLASVEELRRPEKVSAGEGHAHERLTAVRGMLSWLPVAHRSVVLVDGSGKALGANLTVELAHTEDGKRTGADKRAAAAERAVAAELAA